MEAELAKRVYPEARSRICFSILVPTPSGFLSGRGQQASLAGSGRCALPSNQQRAAPSLSLGLDIYHLTP